MCIILFSFLIFAFSSLHCVDDCHCEQYTTTSLVETRLSGIEDLSNVVTFSKSHTSKAVTMTAVYGTYVGCFRDANIYVTRPLPNELYSSQSSSQACFQKAQQLGYQYVGFEFWNGPASGQGECWAGNSLSNAESQGASTNCAQVMSTDGSVMWAGSYAIAVYDLSSSYFTGTVIGCFAEDTNGIRALPNYIYANQPGYHACFLQAQLLGYRYVGLMAWNAGWQTGTNDGECWGGNSLSDAESQGVSTNCAQVTSTDGNVLWAGGAAMALYELPVNTIMNIAGTGLLGSSGDNGPATNSQLNYPWGITVDKSGNVYIADNGNQKIRLVSNLGIITTYAGTGTAGSSGDGGAATSAQLYNPEGLLAVDTLGVYIADRDNHKIRLVTNSVQTLSVYVLGSAGMYPWNVLGGNPNAKWIWMNALASTSSYADYTPYTFSGSFVSTSSYTGTIEVCVDDFATVYFNGQLIQPVDSFRYESWYPSSTPQQVNVGVITGTNNIVVIVRNTQGCAGILLSIKSNTGNYVYSTDGTWTYLQKSSIITTIAGTGTAGNSGDGGSAILAQLHGPNGLARDLSGNLYISDYRNNKIRLLSAAGIISTFAGTGVAGSNGDGGLAINAQLNLPVRMNVDTSGNVYIPDSNQKIRMVNRAGIITTFAGTGQQGGSGDDGLAINSQFNNPSGIDFDKYGNVYIVDVGNNKIRKINSAGIITTIAGTGTQGDSGDGAAATSAQFNWPSSLAIDTSNHLYIADWANNRVRMVVLQTVENVINTVVGAGVQGYSGDGGFAFNAQLYSPQGVFLDRSTGYPILYIADCKYVGLYCYYTSITFSYVLYQLFSMLLVFVLCTLTFPFFYFFFFGQQQCGEKSRCQWYHIDAFL